MGEFIFNKQIKISAGASLVDVCFDYSISELERLLKKVNISSEIEIRDIPKAFCICIQGDLNSLFLPNSENLQWDGFFLVTDSESISIYADTAKGILNGVYELVEQLGFCFLLPGNDGEHLPEKSQFFIKEGVQKFSSLFEHHGVFWESLTTKDFSVEEWLRFYAKLKFNTVSHDIEDLELCKELGLRLETGGHGLSQLMPRDQFEEHPEYYRMFQPEDFKGVRTNDSNFCITNAQTANIIKENFKKELTERKEAYAFHAWADDLPAGGWCLCPNCRAFCPSDQAMLATKTLVDVVRENHENLKFPFLAYHDTIRPGKNVKPPAESFLLFAPRERCYGHALDDENCPRNQFYFKALKDNLKHFEDVEDSHCLEYYFDQVLFRGMYPFLPKIILQDLKIYKKAGIKTHLSLQVAGPAIAPEHNMLFYAKAHWHSEKSADDIMALIAKNIAPNDSETWLEFLNYRADAFTEAMQFCGYPIENYMDYRWLPENDCEFGLKMIETYKHAAGTLLQMSRTFLNCVDSMSKNTAKLAEIELKRAEFEISELMVMHFQQIGITHFGSFWNSEENRDIEQGIAGFEKAIEQFKITAEHAKRFGLSEDSRYIMMFKWLSKEFTQKIATYAEYIK